MASGELNRTKGAKQTRGQRGVDMRSIKILLAAILAMLGLAAIAQHIDPLAPQPQRAPGASAGGAAAT